MKIQKSQTDFSCSLDVCMTFEKGEKVRILSLIDSKEKRIMTVIYVVCYCQEHLKNLALTQQTFVLVFSGFTGIDKTSLNHLLNANKLMYLG